LIGAGLVLSACGGTAKSASAADSSATDTPAGSSAEELNPNACGDETFRAAHAEYCDSADPLNQGPVTEAADFGDGTAAMITGATTEPNPHGDEFPDEADTLLTVTVEFTNSGPATVPFDLTAELSRGVNGYSVGHWNLPGEDLPARLVPGTSATATLQWLVDGATLGTEPLALTLNPGSAPSDWTFSDVQDALTH
jgi:hypothetical protein